MDTREVTRNQYALKQTLRAAPAVFKYIGIFAGIGVGLVGLSALLDYVISTNNWIAVVLIAAAVLLSVIFLSVYSDKVKEYNDMTKTHECGHSHKWPKV